MKKKLSITDREIIQKSFLPNFDVGKECWTKGALPEDYPYYFSEEPFNSKGEKGQSYTFSYINNPDGSVRWIFDANSKFPGFLDLYNASGLKGKILTILFRILFLLKLQSLVVSGRFYFFSRKLSLQESWKLKLDFDSFSMFTGTVGPNRKVLFALHKKSETIGFIKHPISYDSLCLVSTENMVLKSMEDTRFKHMLLPKSKYLGDGDVYVNNVKSSKTRSSHAFTDLHALALKDLYQLEKEQIRIKDSAFYKDLTRMIAGFKFQSEVPFHRELCFYVKRLFELIDVNQAVNMTWAHMDFTPWNLFVPSREQKLAVIDWELAKPGIPMLFDLFHFVFQSKILVERQDYKNIDQTIEQLVSENAVIKQLVLENNMDVKLHFRLYLLHNVAYYLNIYQKQADLHMQVNWLTAVWKEALLMELKLCDNKSHRAIFIADLFAFMQHKKYVWLHSSNTKTKHIKASSDLDFVLTKSARKAVLAFCDSHVLITRHKTFQKSFMSTCELFFKDGSFLSLDLIIRLVRKNLVFMDAQKMLERAVINSEGISVPCFQDDLSYTILFYTLNKSLIPSKYRAYYKALWDRKQIDLLNLLQSKFGLQAGSSEHMFQTIFNNASIIKREVSNYKFNAGISLFVNSLKYVVDTVRSLFFQKGLVITFSGVDGAGKSTLISDITFRLEKYYRKKVVVLRHRPSLFPILSAFKYGKKEAEKRAEKTLPHQGKNRGLVSSVLRFSYYYTDYLLGQIYVKIRYLSRGYVVLYDRYYFDFINDPRRSNISISKALVNRLYRFIHKPKHNFFFYASPEIIRKRKKELSASDISRLTQNYFSTFNRYEKKYTHSKYHCIENINREETVQEVFNQVQCSL